MPPARPSIHRPDLRQVTGGQRSFRSPRVGITPHARRAHRYYTRRLRALFSPHRFAQVAPCQVPAPNRGVRFLINSRYRARVTPAKRGRGSRRCSTGDSQAPTPGERRASMAGFCSCKTGIHAIHGNNVGAAPEARIRHRHRDLPGLWRGGEDHRLHPTAGMREVGRRRKPKPRGPSGNREDSDPPRQQRPFHRHRALAAVPGAAPEQLVRLIHHLPLRGCESQRRGAVTVVPMAGEVATCAAVWEFSRPARPDDRPMTADTTSKRQLTAD